MADKRITLEAEGEFPFNFYIEKAVATEVEKELLLEGVASTTNLDHDNERMSKEALHAMANIINEKSVPLRVEHSKSENAVIGRVFKAWVDERNQLHIRASLDKSHPVSPILHHSMKIEGKKMGFSVGGLVKRAIREFSESAGKLVKTFYDVELKEVSVTPRPANYDSWAISKSIAKDEVEAERVRGIFQNEFLFANPQLDYLQVFAKSVPDEAWRRVEASQINKNETTMTSATEEEKTTKKTEEETETEKAVSRQEFGVVVKGIETLTKAFEALVSNLTKDMDSGPKDQAAPSKEKPEDESPTAKAEEGPKDQTSPDKAKPEDESPTAKANGRTGQENGGEDTEGSDLGGTREKTKTDKTDEYDMETVTRSISTLANLSKRLEGMKKAEDTEEETKEKAADSEETEAEKGVHPLDKFVLQVTKTMEGMVKAMETKGINVLGFEKSIVDRIKDDPKLQEEIHKMLKMPGAKRSVSMGVPYMVTKTGKRFSLTATEVGAPTIEKSSKSDKRNFKDVYKSEFSSTREEE